MSKAIRRGNSKDTTVHSEETVTVDRAGDSTSTPKDMYNGVQIGRNKAGDVVRVRQLYSDAWLDEEAPDTPRVAYFD